MKVELKNSFYFEKSETQLKLQKCRSPESRFLRNFTCWQSTNLCLTLKCL